MSSSGALLPMTVGVTVERVPDATTVLHFRHWLERHELTKVLFDEVGAMLEERGLLMRQSLPRRRPGARSSMRRSSPRRPRPRTRRRAATGDAPDQEGQPVVLRDEGAYRGGCCLGGALFALANLVIVKKTLLAQARA
jgi:IS5 family transposase